MRTSSLLLVLTVGLLACGAEPASTPESGAAQESAQPVAKAEPEESQAAPEKPEVAKPTARPSVTYYTLTGG